MIDGSLAAFGEAGAEAETKLPNGRILRHDFKNTYTPLGPMVYATLDAAGADAYGSGAEGAAGMTDNYTDALWFRFNQKRARA